MTTSSLGFHCERPDFTVRSVLDGEEFLVRRECLIQGSEVFRTSGLNLLGSLASSP